MTIKSEKTRKLLLYLEYITFCLKLQNGWEPPEMEERMLKWFEYGHLPENLQAISKPFGELAATIVENVDGGPERTVALRKLLEAKDAAVRAKLNPVG